MKIGKARDIQSRIDELQTGCPNQIRLCARLKCASDMHAANIEKHFHAFCKPWRVRGEWFEYSRTRRMLESFMRRGNHPGLEVFE